MKKMNQRMRYLSRALHGRAYAAADVGSLMNRAQTLAGEIKQLRAQLGDVMSAEGATSADGKAIYDQIAEKKAQYDQLMETMQTEMGAQAQRVAELLTEEMQNAAQLSVPLTAEAHCGKNWLEAKG